MVEKKEVQERIMKEKEDKRVTDDEFSGIIKSVSPGTNLRAALDGSLKAGKGALLVVENDELLPIIDGGFKVNTRFTPQKIVELSKMDGAIVLSKDLKKIYYANVILAPNNKIPTSETGSRHKAAERTAKQTGTLVVAISERRKEITLFYKNVRHPILDTGEMLRKVNEHLQLLEKQRELFDRHIDVLNRMELSNYPALNRAILVLKKGTLTLKIGGDLKKYILELGSEGTLLKARIKEILTGVEKECDLVIRDYTNLDLKKTKKILKTLSYDEILNSDNILKSLAYKDMVKSIPIKGWRILSNTSLSDEEIGNLIKVNGSLGKSLYSGIKVYINILGEEKAQSFKEEIERMKLNA